MQQTSDTAYQTCSFMSWYILAELFSTWSLKSSRAFCASSTCSFWLAVIWRNSSSFSLSTSHTKTSKLLVIEWDRSSVICECFKFLFRFGSCKKWFQRTLGDGNFYMRQIWQDSVNEYHWLLTMWLKTWSEWSEWSVVATKDPTWFSQTNLLQPFRMGPLSNSWYKFWITWILYYKLLYPTHITVTEVKEWTTVDYSTQKSTTNLNKSCNCFTFLLDCFWTSSTFSCSSSTCSDENSHSNWDSLCNITHSLLKISSSVNFTNDPRMLWYKNV